VLQVAALCQGQGAHRITKYRSAVFVIVKHVQTGTGRRQQHSIARLCALLRTVHGLLHGVGIFEWHVFAGQGLPNQRCIAPDQNHGADVARYRFGQGCEVLPLAIATQNKHHFTVCTQAVQGRHGSAYVGTFAVVKKLDSVQNTDRLHPVRLAPVFAQTKQNRC